MKKFVSIVLVAAMCFGTVYTSFSADSSVNASAETKTVGGAVLSGDTADQCADFDAVWEYDNLSAKTALDESGFTDDKNAWMMNSFDRSAYAVYKVGDGKMQTSVTVEITGCNQIIFPVLQYSLNGVDYTNLTTQMTERVFDDIDGKWKKEEYLWSTGAAQWYKKYTITLNLPTFTKYFKIWIPSGGEYTKPISNLDCMYIRSVNFNACDYQTIGENTEDGCEDFANVNSFSNLDVGYYNDNYNEAFGDETVWRIADETKPAEFIFRASEGMTIRRIEMEISRLNMIYFPKIEWSEDGVNYTAVTAEQSKKAYDNSDYGIGLKLGNSTYNTWHKKYSIAKYLSETARYVRISVPANAVDKVECLYFRNITLKAMPVVEYKTSLKDEFKDYFDISTALEPTHLEQFPNMLKSQFNVLVTENALKPWIHSGEEQWSWASADKIVNFAAENGMKVRAHTLVAPVFFDDYSNNQSAWWYKDDEGNDLLDSSGTPYDAEKSRELTLARLENHVKTIVSRYKGKIYAYDVVNEAYKTEDSDGYMRDYTRFWRLLGRRDDSWINKCFEWAHEADPDAVLIYNDNNFTSDKLHQDLVYNKIKEMRDAGIPACVGMQMHYTVDVSLEDMEAMLKRFSGLCDIYITELDMAIMYASESVNSTTISNDREYAVTKSGYYPEYMREETQKLQAMKYASMFDLFRKYSDSIKCVGFWGVYNGQTEHMKNSNSILFDENAEPNLAYKSVIDVSGKMPHWKADSKLPKVRFIDHSINESDNTVTLYTDTAASGNVVANIYTPSESGTVEYFGEKFTLSDTKTINANGRGGITLSLNKAETVPEGRDNSMYVISLTESGKETVWDYFYYNVGENGAIVDNFNDYEKMYALNQMVKNANMTRFGGDWFGITPEAPIQLDKDRYIIYKMPDGQEADKLTLDFWVYDYKANGSIRNLRPTVSVSNDGKNFDTVISANTISESEESNLHYRVETVTTEIPPGMKYIKIDLNRFPECWIVYLERLTIETRGLSQGREYVLNVDKNGEASAAAYGGTADSNACLIIAEYNEDNALSSAEIFKIDIDTVGSVIKKSILPSEENGYFKAYLFENINTLRPLTESASSN